MTIPRIHHRLHLAVCGLLFIAGASLQADTNWGNQFILGSAPTTLPLNDQSGQWTRFTTWDEMTVQGLQLKLADIATEEITVSLQADNGHGSPSGEPLASAIIKSPQEGWNAVRLPETILEAGKVYHLVIDEITAGSANWLQININNSHTQPSGAQDPAWAHGNGNSIATRTTPIFFLELKDGGAFGQPYSSRYNVRLQSARNIPAQRFIFRPSAMDGSAVASISLALSIVEAAEEDYTLALLNENDEILETAKLPGSEVEATPIKYFTFTFSGSTRLEEGKAYAIALFSEAPHLSGAWISSTTDLGQTEAEKATWGGIESHAFKYSDISLKTPTDPETSRDMIFRIGLQ